MQAVGGVHEQGAIGVHTQALSFIVGGVAAGLGLVAPQLYRAAHQHIALGKRLYEFAANTFSLIIRQHSNRG